jgi:hypothetical protein
MRAAVVVTGLATAATLVGLATAAVLADSVTMRVSETVLRTRVASVGAFGAISSGAEGGYVVITGKECGIPGAFFRALGGGTTLAGGHYEVSVPIRTKTTLRAEWKETKSPTVTVTPRAYVSLTKERGGFEVGLYSEAIQVDGKRIRIERLTPAGWRLLQTIVVKSEGYGGWAEMDKVRFKVTKGTTIRAVLPRSQAGPCLLAGYSRLVRT